MADIAVNTFDWRRPKDTHHSEKVPDHVALKIAALELRVSELAEHLKRLESDFAHHGHESTVREVAA